MVLLEDYEHAKARGAKIYCEVLSAATRQGAEHLSQTSREQSTNAIKMALRKAQVSNDKINVVNCHAPGTYADVVEAEIMKELFPVSRPHLMALKSNFGHTGGACGAIELVYTIKAMETGCMPRTLNLTDPIDVDVNFCMET